ncbi:MAG: redox-regulated ATPase YchF [Chlamydiota bacterium]
MNSEKSGLSVGIVGLPNVGKTTLFNAIAKQAKEAKNYPFCTIDPNSSRVELHDSRLDKLAALSKSSRIVYASVTFTDIAGLVKGASKGEGLGNQFLHHIRETSALVHVVRCFDDPDIVHVGGVVHPLDDIETIDLELILSDLQIIETIGTRLQKKARSDKKALEEFGVIEKMRAHLEKSLPLRSCLLSEEEKSRTSSYPFITQKPVIYVANVLDSELTLGDNPHVRKVREKAEKEGNRVIVLSAKIEQELSQLEDPEEFLEELGIQKPALQTLVRAAFDTLDLITFITTGEMETKAWVIARGTPAKKAAGSIHSDIEKGFIRAEVIGADKLIALGSRVQAKEQGALRIEGKDYLVQDGDVAVFLHN